MKQFLTALRFSFKEQINNRFALGLLIVFVPVWFWMLGAITPNSPVPFKSVLTGELLQVNGHELVLLTSGFSALAMILGFMFFHSAHRSLIFDKRLMQAGFSRTRFVAAKALTLAVVTAVVALYTLGILLLFWHHPNNIFEVWIGFWSVSLVYGAFGLLLGMLIDNELVGFFLAIMVSMCDTGVQVPIGNPAANKDFLKFFPSYGAEQLGVSGGFTHHFASSQFALSLGWFIGFLLVGLGIFALRTRLKNNSTRVKS